MAGSGKLSLNVCDTDKVNTAAQEKGCMSSSPLVEASRKCFAAFRLQFEEPNSVKLIEVTSFVDLLLVLSSTSGVSPSSAAIILRFFEICSSGSDTGLCSS